MDEYVIDVSAGEHYEPKLESYRNPSGRVYDILPDRSVGDFHIGCHIAWTHSTGPLCRSGGNNEPLTITGFYKGLEKYGDPDEMYARLSNTGCVRLKAVKLWQNT